MPEAVILIAGLIILLFIFELVYFRLADHFNIIDKPNERSSHTNITIRGGGVVFVLAGLLLGWYQGFTIPFFWTGFFLISALSFADDVLTLSSKIRMPIQFISVALMIIEVLDEPTLLLFLIPLILITGVINAYNFMDGINGITAGYSLLVLLSIYVINQEVGFIDAVFLQVFIVADLVFATFNFRKKAKCFAGDVGSVSIAFVIAFLILKLIMVTQNPIYILLLAVYGVDSVLTILYRLRKKENIFEAHRSHVYQWLVKPGPFSHLQVSGIYMGTQFFISFGIAWVIKYSAFTQLVYSIVVLLMLGLVYIAIKSKYKKVYGLV